MDSHRGDNKEYGELTIIDIKITRGDTFINSHLWDFINENWKQRGNKRSLRVENCVY